jgi:hypothetical protein
MRVHFLHDVSILVLLAVVNSGRAGMLASCKR